MKLGLIRARLTSALSPQIKIIIKKNTWRAGMKGPEVSSHNRDKPGSRPTFQHLDHGLVTDPNRAPPTRPRKHNRPVWLRRVCRREDERLQFAQKSQRCCQERRGELRFQAGPHNKLLFRTVNLNFRRSIVERNSV